MELLLNNSEVAVELTFKLQMSDGLLFNLGRFSEVSLPAPNTFERLTLVLRGDALRPLLPGRSLPAQLLNPFPHRDTIFLHPTELSFRSASGVLRFAYGGGHESLMILKLSDHSLKA
jgi:hypothetical protein